MSLLGDVSREEAKTCVGSGWAGLIDEAYDAIDAFQEQHPATGVKVQQVKEKFGWLTIYISPIDADPIRTADAPDRQAWSALLKEINRLVTSSALICEACGTTEGVRSSARGGYWIKTMCDSCWKQRMAGETA